MDISVIIPTYKPGSYVWECLDSVYNQTFPGRRYEVIIILNGCNEPYYSQIEEYISSHSDRCTFSLIQTDESGVSNARNIGIENSNGKYLTFVDDDELNDFADSWVQLIATGQFAGEVIKGHDIRDYMA